MSAGAKRGPATGPRLLKIADQSEPAQGNTVAATVAEMQAHIYALEGTLAAWFRADDTLPLVFDSDLGRHIVQRQIERDALLDELGIVVRYEVTP